MLKNKLVDEPGALRHAAVIEFQGAPIAWFYAELGFDIHMAAEIPEPDYMGTLSGGTLNHVSIRKLANSQGSLIEVISVPSAPSDSAPPWNHIAISVRDCSATVEALLSGGASLVGGPVASTSGPYLVAYIRDPSGNLVELVQRLTESD